MKGTGNVRMGFAMTFLLAAMQLQGCATGMTEQERYERDALRAERTDEIRQYIKSCEDANRVALYYGPTTQKLLDPFKYIPRHARKSDYACASERDVERAQREMGIGS